MTKLKINSKLENNMEKYCKIAILSNIYFI